MEMYWVLIERSQLGFGIYLQLLQVSVLLQWKTNPKPHRRPHDINFTPNRAKNVLRPRPNTPNLTIIASQKPEEEQPTRNGTEMSFMLASESNHKTFARLMVCKKGMDEDKNVANYKQM